MMEPRSHRLDELAAGIVAAPAIPVRDITLDSRAVTPGALFLACRGRTTHGLKFAQQAIDSGASAVLYDDSLAATQAQHVPGGSSAFVAAVPQLERHAGTLADRFFGAPSQELTVAGITGTNGKTTCAWLLAEASQQTDRTAGYMGTLGYGFPPSVTATGHTTPDVVSVHRQLAMLRELGAECVCMEVTSHAMDQERVAGVRFNTAAFTNLTRDHLDYHGTMEAYGAAKARLFSWPTLANRVINVDDSFGADLAKAGSPARLIVTTRQALGPVRSEFVRAVRATAESAGLAIEIESSWGGAALTVPLIGDFNVENVLTVLAVLLAWNVPLDRAAASLAQCRAPSGRMELFGGTATTPLIIVDFAHTPDGLEKALQAARRHCKGQLRVVFGCGGDRDAGKRPVMGRLASQLADDVIVTDDNPRNEDPGQIVADILTGMGDPRAASIEHDRARAIRMALHRSSPGDVVLIAGKGHEDYQIYGTTRRAFSDQAVVRTELEGSPA